MNTGSWPQSGHRHGAGSDCILALEVMGRGMQVAKHIHTSSTAQMNNILPALRTSDCCSHSCGSSRSDRAQECLQPFLSACCALVHHWAQTWGHEMPVQCEHPREELLPWPANCRAQLRGLSMLRFSVH